ncbi:LADA_0F06920g1_1 [Lachancea dasiensis]|uniref:LADA_0F06920g1_1 n=1 Tax=Lachancea dasiensis TaxID=1072105 RepID=A0A1G4JKI9_9SACH|nr:LADA_0F06920g1_1 [Lachancea dasiensis]
MSSDAETEKLEEEPSGAVVLSQLAREHAGEGADGGQEEPHPVASTEESPGEVPVEVPIEGSTQQQPQSQSPTQEPSSSFQQDALLGTETAPPSAVPQPSDTATQEAVLQASASAPSPILKRSLDDEHPDSHFKKPRLPATGVEKVEENDDDNDADEDEDEAEDEMLDKTESQGPAAANISRKPTTAATASAETHSSMEAESTRLAALKEITEIERQFAELRQKLHDSKMAKLQTETQMCLEGSHPALQDYYQKIDSVRDFKLRRAYQRQKYELECIDKETKATRCFIHQNFQRKVSNLKHDMLVNTTQRWYDINKERREMDIVVPDVNYHVPVKIDGKTLSCITGYAAPAQLRREGDPLSEDLQCEGIQIRFKNNPVDKLEVIVDRMRFNNELSDLEGLKRFFDGFPGAPSLSGLKDSEIYEDLQAMQRNS